jgi:hypothetical protein
MHGTTSRIDANALHRSQVDDNATFAGAVPSSVVAATPHCNEEVVGSGEVDGLHNVGRASTSSDQSGSSVYIAIPDPTGFIIAIITWAE